MIEKAYFKGVAVMFIIGCDFKENFEVLNICLYFDYIFLVIGVYLNNLIGVIDGEIVES